MTHCCSHCGKSFAGRRPKDAKNKFCSSSCAAKHSNAMPGRSRREKTKQCVICGEYIYASRNRCPKCIASAEPPDITLKEAIYTRHHKSSAYALVRARARAAAKKLGMSRCEECGYSKHVEIAHINAISSYPLDTRLSIINAKDNIRALCPNCHWEYDHPKK